VVHFGGGRPCNKALCDKETQRAWGMMFLGDFLVFEGIVMLKKKGRFEPLAWEAYALINYLGCVERRVFIFAILIHFGIVL
jgi:hypothetical protein